MFLGKKYEENMLLLEENMPLLQENMPLLYQKQVYQKKMQNFRKFLLQRSCRKIPKILSLIIEICAVTWQEK